MTICRNEEAAVEWAVKELLLPSSKSCPKCRKDMCIKRNGRVGALGAFVCKNRKCQMRDKETARSKGSWFDNTQLSVAQVISLTYSFARLESYSTARYEAATDDYLDGVEDTSLSQHTICDWYSFAREIVVADFLEQRNYSGLIGGAGIIVQVDESKFQSRKYHRGRRVLGHWILGIIADGSDDLRLGKPTNEKNTQKFT